MNSAKLTKSASAAHNPRMTGAKRTGAVMAMMGAIPLVGCINLEAPDEPIVIELNINITQEVIYRLAEDAENTIDENADIF
ncbi:MAG: YnbE family lipoprotein [Alteraurantiacibacter sp. bin_em_oilr2.035]|uniref:YnbE family lipoprotein n=1 Tax=Aurantiacibacter atlanticus TaxID=1648404 RepID=UPI000A4BCD2F|nr:YnbE family lipoprotein [Aurantiacibacter atlanticus]MDF1835159.1 YnbE family lipoprotein [Alteraurantiacibacter sp. bin_em_oilr2.035]